MRLESGFVAVLTKLNELVESYGLNPAEEAVVLSYGDPDKGEWFCRLQFETYPSHERDEARYEQLLTDLGSRDGEVGADGLGELYSKISDVLRRRQGRGLA